MAAHVRRRDGNLYSDGDDALPLTEFALAFSPVCPLSENDGKTTEFAPLILFSPRKPRFRRRCAPLKVSLWRRMSAVATRIFILTGDNALLLTTFALAFSPVDPFSVAAFAALRVSFPGACPEKDEFLF